MCIIAFLGYFAENNDSWMVNYIFTCLVVGFALVTFIVPWKAGPEVLTRPDVEKRIGTLYAEVKTDKAVYFTFTSVFCARRILFVLLLV